MLSDTNARLAAARRLTSRKGRRDAGRFLAEGAQAVGEALARPDVVVEVFATAEAMARNATLLTGVAVDEVSLRAAGELGETIHPQGLFAVCRAVDVPLADALVRRPRLVAGLVQANDPGNAGTILRTADAAGAGAVVLAGDGVDVYNGKAVRASAGSVFHVDVVLAADPLDVIGFVRGAGLRVLATTGHPGTGQPGNGHPTADHITTDLDLLIDDGSLAAPTMWLFGNEAHGLPPDVLAASDLRVRVPIHGRAESLNLAAAAAICLYASARAQRRDEDRAR